MREARRESVRRFEMKENERRGRAVLRRNLIVTQEGEAAGAGGGETRGFVANR